MSPGMTRRRFIRISAATAGLALLPPGANAAVAEPILTVWRGTALGALASIELYHPDRGAAARLIERSVRELERLERVFSLYREDSALVRLNRDGFLDEPPADLVRLLSASLSYSRLTGGAFDPTVQPLWDLYARHFSVPNADPAGPAEAALRETVLRVGCTKMTVDPACVALAPGMAVTLNGIAQGYITDRVTELLRSEGIASTLVDLGEIRTLGRHPDGRSWTVGLEDPDRRGRAARTIEVENQAVATSGGYGFRFDPAGRFTHLFDPKTGTSPHVYSSVSVALPTATAADALSTAFSLMPVEAIDAVLARLGEGTAYLTRPDGTTTIRRTPTRS